MKTKKNFQLKEILYLPESKIWWMPASNQKNKAHTTCYWGADNEALTVYHSSPFLLKNSKPISFRTLVSKEKNKNFLLPLIGILTCKGFQQPFAGSKPNFIDLISAARHRGGIIYVFTAEDINWSQKKVKGFLYHPKQKQWVSSTFPLPNVIYNRIPHRDYERKPTVKACLEKLKRMSGISLFNPHFFNKQELYEILEQSPLQEHIPKTHPLTDRGDLETILKKYPSLFLKPSKGRAGQGIMKASWDEQNNHYSLHVQTKKNTKKIKTKTLEQLWSVIGKLRISSPYVLQQAINLQHYQNSPFDFRILVQKNGSGDWQVSGLGLRVAGANRITTHVPKGGRIESPLKVLTTLFSKEKSIVISNQVKDLAIKIAQHLENSYGLLGEMSMDIGLDQEGKLWFFEANAKPMKFDEPDIRQRSLYSLIDYARFLSIGERMKDGRDATYSA